MTFGKDEKLISEVCGEAAFSNLIPCSGTRLVSAGFLPKCVSNPKIQSLMLFSNLKFPGSAEIQ